jgi:hypothetical protein
VLPSSPLDELASDVQTAAFENRDASVHGGPDDLTRFGDGVFLAAAAIRGASRQVAAVHAESEQTPC